MSKTSNKIPATFRAGLGAVYCAQVEHFASVTAGAEAQLARFALYAFADGVDVESIVGRMRCGAVAENSGAQYASRLRRIVAQGAEFVAGIIAERDACETWVGFAAIIRAYDVPAASTRGRKAGQGAGKSTKAAGDEADAKAQAVAVDTLPGFTLAFQTMCATVPKVTASGEVRALMQQTLALLRQELSRDAKAKAATL